MKRKAKRRSGNPWSGVKADKEAMQKRITELENRCLNYDEATKGLLAEIQTLRNNDLYVGNNERVRIQSDEILFLRQALSRMTFGPHVAQLTQAG